MQKDTVEVIINSDGKSCTTTNPLGIEPTGSSEDNTFRSEHRRWQQAEAERKTHEISNQVMFPEECWDSVGMCLWNPGSIYKAIIINNKAVIL